jgi:hypothetical protein
MPGRYTHVKPMLERHYPDYKYREMLTAIGNDLDIQQVIMKAGFEPPTVAVIRGWRRRNSIPPRWLPLLMHKAQQKGDLSSIDNLIKAPF